MNRLFPSLRTLALVALAWMVAFEGDAQLLISTGGTVTGCDDALTDAGGPAGPYGANEDFTITLCVMDIAYKQSTAINEARK